MDNLLHAYEAYERRSIRGEFSMVKAKHTRPGYRELLLSSLADFLIAIGLKLKRKIHANGQLALSPFSGRSA
jgi:hypothetical protein